MAAQKRSAAKKTWHVHCCRGCRVRYVDGCPTPAEDELCTGCRGGRPWQELLDNAAPQQCCLDSRLVTKDERTRYRLAGTSNWHICRTCKRTQGYKPTTKEIRT